MDPGEKANCWTLLAVALSDPKGMAPSLLPSQMWEWDTF
jgi:hypothetical protein